jgi:hypothetical protein
MRAVIHPRKGVGKMRSVTLLLCAATISLSSCTHRSPDITQAELTRRTQAMADAVATGDKSPWQRNFADDGLFFDEKGRSMDKPALLADLTGLPPGFSGTIQLNNVQSRITPDTAILAYDQDETETVFGRALSARYHSTDTWLRRNGTWQIVASQTMRYYEDPAGGTPDTRRFKDYLGTYELAPGRTRKIITESGALYLARPDGTKEELLNESGDLFFRKGIEGRILFHYAQNGKVDILIDRRNNEDLLWKKIG